LSIQRLLAELVAGDRCDFIQHLGCGRAKRVLVARLEKVTGATIAELAKCAEGRPVE
jgi:hypothetical protein